MQYQSVYDLIRRALPGKESCFLLREMKVEEAATGQNCYCVSSEGEKIILSGDCVISLCMAFYAYLREECGVNPGAVIVKLLCRRSCPFPRWSGVMRCRSSTASI